MFRAMAEREITLPLTSDGPVPPNVSMLSVNDETANRLADLDPDGTVSVRDDAVELREVNGARIDIEAARALAEGFDLRVDSQLAHNARKFTKPMPLGPGAEGDFLLGGPSDRPSFNCRALYG